MTTARQAQFNASKAKSREAKRNAGLVPLEVWVPHDKVPEVKAFIASLAESHKATTAP